MRRRGSMRAKIKKLSAALGVSLLLIFVALGSLSAEVVDRIVAQVNEEIITLYELEEAMLPYLIQQGENPMVLNNPQGRARVMEETLEDMVDRILIEQEARKMELEVSSEQVDRWLAETRNAQNMTEQQFRQAIAQYGIAYEDYRKIIRDNLLRMTMMQARARGGGISEAEVESIYRRRFGDAGIERYVEVRHILLVPDSESGGEEGAREKAEELRARIEGGELFEEIAGEYSQGPGANQGGYLGQFRRGQLEASLEAAIFSLEEGELSGPVQTPFGIHLIQVLSVEERSDANVEQRKNQIRMMLQERQMERQMTTMLQTLRARAFVDVRL